MQTLQLDEFLRSIKQNIDTPHSLLLGAGASIESGIPSAADCIWDWKREIYLSQNPGAIGNFDNSKSESVRRVIQRWIDSQNIYPAENSAEEYSYFAEKAYPIEDDRRKYFQHLTSNHDPSLGYHLISLLALENIIRVYLKTVNMPKQRVFSACCAPFSLVIHKVFLRKNGFSRRKIPRCWSYSRFSDRP